jgi:PKD repeat protein
MKKVFGVLFLVLFLFVSIAYAKVEELDLSVAYSNSAATLKRLPNIWQLAKAGWVQNVETSSDLASGTFDRTKLNSDGKVVIAIGGGICSGSYISRVFDLSQTAGDEILNFNLYVPTGANGKFYLRSGTNPSSMGSWSEVPSTGYPIRNIIGSNNYMQYKVEMGSNSSCVSTPTFSGITLTWLRFTADVGRVLTAKVDDMYAYLIKGVSIEKDEPSGTEIRWAVSDDNGVTYKVFQSGSWVAISSYNVHTQGNTTSELQSIPQTAWKLLSPNFMRLIFSLKSQVNYLTPSVSSIEVTYDTPEVVINSLSCPQKLYIKERGSCQVSSQTNIGTLSYQWSGPSDVTITPNGSLVQLSFNSSGRKTVKIKVYISQIPSTFIERTATIDVPTPPKPKIGLNGPKGVMFGESATYQAEVTCPERLNCSFKFIIDGKEFSDNPVTVLFTEKGKHTVVAQSWDPEIPGSLAETSLSPFVSEVSKPVVSISAPKKVELGVPFTVTAKISASYGTPSGYWVLPDGSRVNGDTLTYTATRKMDDLKFKYVAFILGFSYTETMVESSPIKVDVYEMPQFKIKSFQKLDKPLYAPYGAFFGVTGDIGVVKDFGVTLSHQWDFGDGTVIEGGNPGRISHIYSEGGTYTVKLSVFDDRGNSSVDSLNITILDPPPLAVGPFKLVASNKYNRAPLSLYVKPVVTGGNPALDKVSSYQWFINGEAVSDGRMLKVTLNDPGDYLVGLRVETKTGKVAEGENLIRVNPNQLPVCEISYQDYPKYKYTKIFSSCYDPDGKIKSYFWDLGDGTTSERAKVFAKYETSGTYEVTLTVIDDSGAQATFSMPVIVER